jgi:hypothetical protein
MLTLQQGGCSPKGQGAVGTYVPRAASCVTGRRSNLNEAARENVRELAD